MDSYTPWQIVTDIHLPVFIYMIIFLFISLFYLVFFLPFFPFCIIINYTTMAPTIYAIIVHHRYILYVYKFMSTYVYIPNRYIDRLEFKSHIDQSCNQVFQRITIHTYTLFLPTFPSIYIYSSYLTISRLF